MLPWEGAGIVSLVFFVVEADERDPAGAGPDSEGRKTGAPAGGLMECFMGHSQPDASLSNGRMVGFPVVKIAAVAVAVVFAVVVFAAALEWL